MGLQISIRKIEAKSLVDGPGERTVLFVQGCPIECQGCQNIQPWDKTLGRVEPVEVVAETLGYLAGAGGRVTIRGGEPFAQPRALAALLRLLRVRYSISHILVYSGFTWEYLTSLDLPIDLHCSVIAALRHIDVLLDGPIILDWDVSDIAIVPDGNAPKPVGLAPTCANLGIPKYTHPCVQTKGTQR